MTPTRGAIVRAHYETHVGSRVLMTLIRADGSPIPFGATASQAHQDGEFIVGDGGQVYLTGMLEKGTIDVSWGQTANSHCTAIYHLPTKDDAAVINITAQCV